MKLQMDENALSSRVKMLTEMEKLHEGYSKAVKLVMGEAQRGSLQHIHGPGGRPAEGAGGVHRGH